MKTDDPAVAAGHSVDPARWQYTGIAARMIDRALDAGVPASWVAGGRAP
ncbi:hypothetical protein [Streptomyces sp. NPDC093060]